MNLKFKKLHPDAVLPSYAKPGDAGLDITAVSDGVQKVQHPENCFAYIEFKTGLAVEIPPGYVGLIFPRSSISKTVLSLANAVGVIDSGYRGEICFRFKIDPAIMVDPGVKSVATYKKGDRIGQLIVVPFPTVSPEWADELGDTERGDGGFGSSGQ